MMADRIDGDYVRVCSPNEIGDGHAIVVGVGRYEIAVFHIGGEFMAYENVCPHQGGPIGEGYIEGATVTCPWHAWCFDLHTGSLTIGNFATLTRFDVRVDADGVYVSPQPLPEAL